ncbi:MAG: beta-galactosidase, partial [Opitutaceae bacterium]|nr:beta-galactosidase [Opitutaceae bacterium]
TASTAPPTAIAPTTNPVANPGFESPVFSPWSWATSKNAEATGAYDSGEKASGHRSFKLTNASSPQPNVYGVLRQAVTGLRANTSYEVTFQIRGNDVTGGVFACGPGWGNRKAFPVGTYDWREFRHTFTTGDKAAPWEILFITSAPAAAIWIDDVTITPLAASTTAPPAISQPALWTEGIIPASAAFYPVFFVNDAAAATLDHDTTLPVLRLRIDPDPAPASQQPFGADIRIARDARRLLLHITLLDPTPGPWSRGEGLWRMDSIQLALDTGASAAVGGRVNNYHEIAFAPASASGGTVTMHDQESATDLSRIETSTTKKPDGYTLALAIPWEAIALDPARLPAGIGINIVANDGGPKGLTRRFVEWTPGTARVKDRSAFARALFVPAGSTSVQLLKNPKNNYDISDTLRLTYAEYARASLPAQTLRLRIKTPDNRALPPIWPDTPLAPLAPGTTRLLRLTAPAALLPGEGAHIITAATPQASTETVVRRHDIHSRIATGLASAQKTLADIQKQTSATPAATDDPLIQADLAIARTFLERVADPVTTRKQTPVWSLLQLDEVAQILDAIKTRLSSPSSLTSPSPSPADGIRNKNMPDYHYGYGHFGDVVRDLPLLSRTGSTLIQQERGPRDLQPDGTLTPDIRRARDILDRAALHGVKVDFLLSSHYFPKWAMDADPTLAQIVSSGFVKYNIDHPTARQIHKDWLQRFLPTIKDHPALLSLCISNEPVYLNSGHDPWSRPEWETFLKNKHGTLAAINALYTTTSTTFAEIPIPSPALTSENIGQRRLLYDWIRFNHRHFADWHRWVNDIVKKTAPGLPTHSKIMMDIFERTLLPRIAEPELMCEITDLAGNDASAWPAPWSEYSYNWLHSTLWYDLLHSFRGQPVFNSENHLIRDGTPPEHIPPAHTRTVLWQGALHHMPLTTIWVWNEGGTPALEGSIYFRPANISAASRTMFDLRRLAAPVSAISAAPAKVALLYSITSLYWNDDYARALCSAYAALNFLGQPVTFISEKQLAENRRTPATHDVRILLLPGATHLPDATVSGLAGFVKNGGILVPLGEGNLALDEYNRPRALPPALRSALAVPPISWKTGKEKTLSAALAPILEKHNLARPRLLDASSREPAWGVEYRIVHTDGDRILVSMTNFLPASQTVALPGILSLSPSPAPATSRDLLNGGSINLDAIELPPLHPRLIEIIPATASVR